MPPVLSVAQWRERLASEQAVERAQAALALAQARDAQSLPAVRSLLHNDTASNVRAAAALALGDWQDRASTQAIARLLAPDAQVDAAIVLDALRRMGDPRAAPQVLPYLDADDDVMRLLAVETLVAMQAREVGGLILQRARANSDPARAKTYAMALGKLQVSSAQSYLLELAQTSAPSPTRWASYLALGRIRSESAVPLLVNAMAAPHEKGRENAQQALVAIGSPQAAPRLWPLLDHAERGVRFAAADVLVGLDHPDSNAVLLQALARPLAQAPAALALGRRKEGQALAPVQALLIKADSPEREVLAQSLGWLGERSAVPVLRQVLAEVQGEGRYGAAWSLGVLQAREARADLERAASQEDNRLAQIALEALGQLADPASADFLARLAQSQPQHALAALASLAQIPGDAARTHLLRLASHRDAPIARAALQALGQRAEAAAVAPLIDMLEKAAGDERNAVQQSLVAITGQHWETPAQWREWRATTTR